MNRRDLALIAAGGSFGACARYGLSEAWPNASGQFPTTTLFINLIGAFALGVLLEWLQRTGRPEHWSRFALGVGLLGAFTTFSTFTTEIVLLIRDDHSGTAFVYAAISVGGGIGAVFAGLLAAGWRRPPLPDEGES